SEVIKNSVDIATEPIRIYLLNTVQEDLNNEGTVRIYIIGKKDSQKRNRTILIVGETGTGKSSIINMVVNYMLGVKWEDKIRFEIIPDEGTIRQTESQTIAITAYEVFGLEELSVPFSLTVIDTPGYGDTGGLEKDQSISQNLYKLFNSTRGIQQIDVVCLVVKATENRLTPSQKYIFDAILSLFGKNMEKNILTLITFSDWLMPSEALEAITESGFPFPKNENNEPAHILFNNISSRKYQKKCENVYKTSWDNGIDSMREFFQTLYRMET
ncbi:uncharacterized protein LOC135260280, partial [Anguilla rostrata]|uniref:uncharacterized protein LOC135260280 n=1 Tax=Anguilla rostrata TaxID=7938 RepID=UPI0030CDFF2B